MCGGFDPRAQWSIQFPQHEGIKCYAVVSGSAGCRWRACRSGAPEAGDCFLLAVRTAFPPGKRSGSDACRCPDHILASCARARSPPAMAAESFFRSAAASPLTGAHAGILLGVLPPIVHIREGSPTRRRCAGRSGADDAGAARAAAGWLSGRAAPRPHDAGAGPAAASGGRIEGGVGWLFALADKQMSAAISAMHEDPAHRWTLQELAHRAGMSRSTLCPAIQSDGRNLADGVPDALAHAAAPGTSWRTRAIPFPQSPCRSATNPKAPSAPPSNGSWALAAAIQSWPECGCPFRWRGASRPRRFGPSNTAALA